MILENLASISRSGEGDHKGSPLHLYQLEVSRGR
jgi:hypothetical protein